MFPSHDRGLKKLDEQIEALYKKDPEYDRLEAEVQKYQDAIDGRNVPEDPNKAIFENEYNDINKQIVEKKQALSNENTQLSATRRGSQRYTRARSCPKGRGLILTRF